MKEKWATIVAVSIVGICLLLYLIVFTVRVSEVAVHKRFGKVIKVVRPTVSSEQELAEGTIAGVKVVSDPGWFWKLPWPFDKVDKYDQRVRLVDGPLAQIQLSDEYQLIPRVYATWQIKDPVAFEKSLRGDVGVAEQRLKSIIGNQTGTAFGSRTLSDVVNTNQDDLKFNQIEEQIFDGVKNELSEMEQAYGVDISSLGITWVALPQGTTDAVFERMMSERARLAEKHRAEGQSDKETKIAQAQATRKTMLAEAEADAKRVRAEAESEAAKYYQTFAQDEDLAVFLRELDAVRKIATAAADREEPLTFVLTTDNPPFGVLKGQPSMLGGSEDLKAVAGAAEEASTETVEVR